MKLTKKRLQVIIREELKSLNEDPKVMQKKYKGKTYKAIPGMAKYKKKGGGYSLGKCMDDLTGKEDIDNPAAVCRAAEITHTGKAHGTREKK